jgi:hypothetical protein
MVDESYLHEATKEAIKKVVHTDPLVLAKERLATVFNWRKRTEELREQETTFNIHCTQMSGSAQNRRT